MCMQTDDDIFALIDIVTKPFNLIGVDIWCCHFNGGRQVQYTFLLDTRLPNINYRITYFNGIIDFCASKAFRRILKLPIRISLLGGALFYPGGTIDGNLFNLVARHFENLLSLYRRGRVINVHYGFTSTF